MKAPHEGLLRMWRGEAGRLRTELAEAQRLIALIVDECGGDVVVSRSALTDLDLTLVVDHDEENNGIRLRTGRP